MILDRGYLAIKIMVANVHDGLGRQPVRQRRESAQIGEPDRGVHRLGVAASDLSTHDPLAGSVADIGIQQARSHAVQTEDLDYPRQWLREAPQRRQLFIREPARLFGGPA